MNVERDRLGARMRRTTRSPSVIFDRRHACVEEDQRGSLALPGAATRPHPHSPARSCSRAPRRPSHEQRPRRHPTDRRRGRASPRARRGRASGAPVPVAQGCASSAFAVAKRATRVTSAVSPFGTRCTHADGDAPAPDRDQRDRRHPSIAGTTSRCSKMCPMVCESARPSGG